MKKWSFIILNLVFNTILVSQYDHTPVFPNLEGEALLIALQENFTPDTVIANSNAKDTLYKRIYAENDSVSCVYTGLTKYLDPNEDPSAFLFGAGTNSDLNLEHSFPKSKGASGNNGENDLHHLFPCRVTVNTSRGNDPFAEVEDNSALRWYYKDETLTTTPTQNLDLYSEDGDQIFEPREDFKGNIARAYFYFYSIYRDEADAEDPNFFNIQKETLCDWHELDPVDSLEWIRSHKIAEYQYGKVNPFVLDCRLSRLYCDSFNSNCQAVNTAELNQATFRLNGNVFQAGGQLILESSASFSGKLKLIDPQGRIVLFRDFSDFFKTQLPLHKGLYYLTIERKNKVVYTNRIVIK